MSSAMKLLLVLLSVALIAVAEDTYSTENDNLDIEAVISNLDKLKAFYGCFMDTSPCDAVQADFKKDLPEVYQLACAKCTDAQKHLLKRFLEALKQKLPEDYASFNKKFDSDNKYTAALETAIAKS